MRVLQLAVFLTTVLLVFAGATFYLWRRLVKDPGWTVPWKTRAGIILIALNLSLLLPIPLGLFRRLSWTSALAASWFVYTWMGLLLFVVFFLAVSDLVRLFRWLILYLVLRTYPRLTRSTWARWSGAVSIGLALLLGGISIVNGLRPPRVVEVKVALSRLPAGLDGLRMVQLSDLHLGPMRGRAWLEDLVRRVDGLNPDIIVVTGDLADQPVARMHGRIDPLRRLAAPLGVFFVTGNHEYYSGWEAWEKEIQGWGWRILSDQLTSVERNGQGFDLMGVQDRAGSERSRAGLGELLKNRDPNRELILLSHRVTIIEEAAHAGVGLLLSGHAHGGQIWPWMHLVELQQPYIKGLHRHESTWVYVSQGTGLWGPPMRLGSFSEITLLILESVRP